MPRLRLSTAYANRAHFRSSHDPLTRAECKLIAGSVRKQGRLRAGVLGDLLGLLDGALALTKNGTGALTISGANTYSGATTIGAGMLRISADNNLGTAPASATPSSLSINSGQLAELASFTLKANRGISLRLRRPVDVPPAPP